MQIKTVKNRFKPLYQHDSEHMLTYSKGYIYLTDIETGENIRKVKLPLNIWQRIFCKIRITERMLRLEPRGIVRLDGNKYNLSFRGNIYQVNLKKEEVQLEHSFVKTMNNPLYMKKISGLADWQDCILYGEYSGNPQREPVAIYRKRIDCEESQWEKCYEFSRGTINHIHNIIQDPYRKGLLILTGDSDSGSGIWLASNEFKEVKPLLIGSQLFRACVALPLEEGILYATDTPLMQNGIYFASLNNGNWESRKLFDMPGPSIYYTFSTDKIIFSTTVEADAEKKGIQYLLSRKLGRGVKDRYVHLIEGSIFDGFNEIGKFKKDFLPMGLFQFGALHFPEDSYKSYGKLFFYGTALKEYDGKWIEIEG